MTAQSPSAYLMSVVVHVAAVLLLVATAWLMQVQHREPARLIELVAGEGDNWAATAAPALGVPEGREDLKMPEVPLPKIPEPEPEPVVQAAPLQEVPPPVAEKVPPVKPVVEAKASPLDTKKTSFTQDVKRLADKREKRTLDKFRKEEAAKQKRITEAEFRKQHATAAKPGSKVVKVDAKGIAGGVVGGSTSNTKGGAGGKALTVAEQNLMDAYFAFLKQRLKASHVAPPGVSDQLTATVQFFLAADGSLSRVGIVRSSGNSEFDQSVLEAFRRTRSIGKRPDGQSDLLELDFNLKDE